MSNIVEHNTGIKENDVKLFLTILVFSNTNEVIETKPDQDYLDYLQPMVRDFINGIIVGKSLYFRRTTVLGVIENYDAFYIEFFCDPDVKGFHEIPYNYVMFQSTNMNWDKEKQFLNSVFGDKHPVNLGRFKDGCITPVTDFTFINQMAEKTIIKPAIH